ncbi:N-acetyldiaminopimelate deacetylase [Staphylospora marina]|uniref:N-acetyldiaminopimelate deacetylase n=1 Tax=Staphylospora marina TaxID=2490858 RepID=UPI000F5B93DC|nr:N-acetyldiaminopimelate deacetylase [Staphylospora marina]
MATPDTFVELRRKFHRIPEPGFKEFKTQAMILEYLATLPEDRVQIRTWQTGILALVPGTAPRRRIAWRTDMDGLPIPEETALPFRSEHEGFMHACGHDLHMAIALGILTHFVHHPIQDDLLFIFQPAEEGPGGAEPMMQSEEFKAWKPDLIFALHIAPEYPVGTIATRPGILFANTSELFIELEGTAGHAARPHLANDMVVAASQLVLQLQTIVSRNIDPLDAAVITIGELHAGTRQNIIAEHAKLDGTIRTLSMESMDKIKKRILQLVQGIEAGFDCKASVDWGCMYCEVYNHPEITRRFMDWAADVPGISLVECREAMTGEDFGYFLKDIPGFMFWLGVATPYGLHHPKINPDERAIGIAIDLMIRWFSRLADQPAEA